MIPSCPRTIRDRARPWTGRGDGLNLQFPRKFSLTPIIITTTLFVRQQEEVLSFAGDYLRGSGGVPARSCVYNVQRLELIRSKDFARWCRSNADKIKASGLLSEVVAEDSDIEAQIKALAELLIERRLLVNAQRKFLKPPPGQKRLIKFPRKVLPVTGGAEKKFNEDGFMCWTYECPTPTWVYVASALAAVGVVAVCLFPVAPTGVKIGVMYVSTTLLAIIVSLLVVRGLIALTTYIVTGGAVWILPNALDDNLPFKDSLKPLVSVDRPDLKSRGDRLKHYLMRLLTLVGTGVLCYVLYLQTPGPDSLKKNVGRYRDDLFDYFNVYNNRDMIGDGKNASQAEEEKPEEDHFAQFADLDDDDDVVDVDRGDGGDDMDDGVDKEL